jgi:hypothetical protein
MRGFVPREVQGQQPQGRPQVSEQLPEHATPRVSFGPKEHMTVPVEVASMLLTLWRERQGPMFSAYLGEVMTGSAPNGRRPRT